MFEPSSRYSGIETKTRTMPDGRVVAYTARRLPPPGASMPTLVELQVALGDRLDLIAGRVLGDPEQFWRICDANDALRPEDLETVGRRIRIGLDQGQ
jgi:hypothetical protein